MIVVWDMLELWRRIWEVPAEVSSELHENFALLRVDMQAGTTRGLME